MAKPALGRGLGALLGGVPASLKSPSNLLSSPGASSDDASERVQLIPVKQIRPCPLQPRKEFPLESLQELADSIRAQGIIQPLIVRARDGAYELIAGERRLRAAQLTGISEVPVIVRAADDRSVLELALIENLQRENLNPIEEAQGYAELMDKFQLRQEDVAGKVGKSRAVVANALRLLKLDAEIQGWLREGRLTVGHAKVILGLETSAVQKLAAERVLKKGLNVRQTEELVAHLQAQATPTQLAGSGGQPAPTERNAHVTDIEDRLRQRLGTRVQLRYKQGKGSVEIRFFSDAELERILQIVGVRLD